MAPALRILIVTFTGLITLMATGCSHYRPSNSDRILSVDKSGRPENPLTGHQYAFGEYSSHIKNLCNGNGKTLLIYIHGGLNTESSANKRADRITAAMYEDGYQPVFINWKSGFITTYREHLFHDRQGEYWRFWGYPSSPFILLEDLGRGIIKTPMVWWYQSNDFLQSLFFGSFPSEERAKQINSNLLKDKQDPFGSVPKVVDEKGHLIDERSGASKAFDGILGVGRLALGLTTAPIFTSLGTGGWDTMKRRANIIIDNPQPEQYVLDGLQNQGGIDTTLGAAANFFDELQRRQQADRSLKVVLVGHSMGTIIASKALRLWPDINYERIIYMAAACPIEDFRSSVAPHLKKTPPLGPKTSFYNYMLHPIAENKEAHGFGIGGTGSLLNQIDNMYENPVSESHRMLGKWVNVMNAIRFFDVPGVSKSQIHLVSMPLDGTKPDSHGSFDNVTFKKGNIWKFWSADAVK